ncbi:MAG TPA: PKD domain-containing protein, partial [candidate division Zixibacteria bacterium]|nr:PKD domain-containing protein [candidate division Zixibacteria bacterium]
ADALGHTAGPSFHFAINNHIYFDNRIPPRGFTNANFESIQSQPIGYSYADGQYWDETTYPIPVTAARVVATLYYQTLSKEYVTFLRDENVTNHWGQTLYDLWETNGKSTPVVMAADTVDLAPMNGQPPIADFSATPLSGAAPLAVSFTDLSANTPTSWGWTFGDGGSSPLQNPSHTYSAAGVYTVSLTATNANGSDTKTVTDYITVTQPGQTATLHVDAITVVRLSANGNREYARATVRIVDQTLAPFAGATVTADFSGPSTETVSGTTDAAGNVVLESRKVRGAAGEWCLTVTNVSGTNVVYDPSANVVTTACESGPAPRLVSDATVSADGSVTLQQNSPNPFNPETKIGFHLAEATQVNIEIFNVNGQRVDELFNGALPQGDHSVNWNASGFASGVYIYRIVTPTVTLSRKMTVLK